MKYSVYIFAVFILIGFSAARAVELSELQIRHVKRNLVQAEYGLTADHSQARTACAKRKQRLPSIREFANWATQYGAEIRETSYPGRIWIDSDAQSEERVMKYDGFKPIYTINYQGRRSVMFYYNNDLYDPRAANKLKELNIKYHSIRLWSSTPMPETIAYSYNFNIENGDIDNNPDYWGNSEPTLMYLICIAK